MLQSRRNVDDVFAEYPLHRPDAMRPGVPKLEHDEDYGNNGDVCRNEQVEWKFHWNESEGVAIEKYGKGILAKAGHARLPCQLFPSHDGTVIEQSECDQKDSRVKGEVLRHVAHEDQRKAAQRVKAERIATHEEII